MSKRGSEHGDSLNKKQKTILEKNEGLNLIKTQISKLQEFKDDVTKDIIDKFNFDVSEMELVNIKNICEDEIKNICKKEKENEGIINFENDRLKKILKIEQKTTDKIISDIKKCATFILSDKNEKLNLTSEEKYSHDKTNGTVNKSYLVNQLKNNKGERKGVIKNMFNMMLDNGHYSLFNLINVEYKQCFEVTVVGVPSNRVKLRGLIAKLNEENEKQFKKNINNLINETRTQKEKFKKFFEIDNMCDNEILDYCTGLICSKYYSGKTSYDFDIEYIMNYTSKQVNEAFEIIKQLLIINFQDFISSSLSNFQKMVHEFNYDSKRKENKEVIENLGNIKKSLDTIMNIIDEG